MVSCLVSRTSIRRADHLGARSHGQSCCFEAFFITPLTGSSFSVLQYTVWVGLYPLRTSKKLH
jgi:hypothetical protein